MFQDEIIALSSSKKKVDPSLISSHIIDVLAAFEALSAALVSLNTQVIEKDANLPVWFLPPPEMPFFPQLSDREKVCLFLHQLEYLEGQPPKEILVGPGIVAASIETMQTIDLVNQCKQRFKTEMLAFKAACGSLKPIRVLHEAFDNLLNKRPNEVARNLQRMGLARLHLKQCYRLIPMFDERPEKITWTWANTKSIRRISTAEADALLVRQGDDGRIAWQRQRLAQLSMDEPLAVVQELAPHLRANIVFAAPSGGVVRKMVKGPVPFFYLVQDTQNPELLPQFSPPKPKKAKDKDRLTRNDVKLDPHCFLPAIRAHRYAGMC